MSILMVLSLAFAPHFEKKGDIVLDVPLSMRLPRILIDRSDYIWYRSFHDHFLYEMDPDGKEVLRIGGKGFGPGELVKPLRILLINKEKDLLVAEVGGGA